MQCTDNMIMVLKVFFFFVFNILTDYDKLSLISQLFSPLLCKSTNKVQQRTTENSIQNICHIFLIETRYLVSKAFISFVKLLFSNRFKTRYSSIFNLLSILSQFQTLQGISFGVFNKLE